jgi:hypothetical protein
MPIKTRNTLLACIAISSCLFFACRKEMEKPSWDTEVLAPLINASLNINNLLPDSILQANPDSSLKIVYNNELYKLNIDSIFKIPDTLLHNAYVSPFPTYLFNPGDVIPFPSVSSTSYSIAGGVQLKTAIIKSGIVSFYVKSLIHEVTDFEYKIPCATLAGVIFTTGVIHVPAAVGTTPGIYFREYDLSGYTFDLTGVLHNTVNTVSTSLSATISPLGSPVTVLNTDSLIIDNTFRDVIPYYAKGYFGQNTYTIGPSTTSFNLFERIVDGTIQLEDVNFNFNIENPIGMDARLNISNISSINTHSGNVVNLTNSIIGSTININRASESGTTVYPTYSNFPLTTTNSNIKPMIENLPNQFGYSMQIVTNPLGNISGSNDFIYSDRLLKARLNMEIPLSLVANNLTLADTLALNIAPTDGTQNIHDGTLTLFANNGFPFDAQVQLYLLNDSNVAVDSIFGYANTIVQAPINASYRAVGQKLTKISIPVSESKMDILYATKKAVLKIKFNTAAQPNYIKIYSDYTIDVKVVGDFNYTIKLQ